MGSAPKIQVATADRAAAIMTALQAIDGHTDAPNSYKRRYTWGELRSLPITEPPCLFAPIFPAGTLALLTGSSDLGKSSLLRQMCGCVAKGSSFLGCEYKGQYKRAIYFSNEDGSNELSPQLKRYEHTELDLSADEADRVTIVLDEPSDTIIATLTDLLKEQRADLVVIDTLANLLDGRNINDAGAVRKFYLPFMQIAHEYGCLILFNHHTGKRTDTYAPHKDNTVGSQSLEAVPRLVIEMRKDDEGYRHLCIVKGNHLTDEQKQMSLSTRINEHRIFSLDGENCRLEELAKGNETYNKKERQQRKIAASIPDEGVTWGQLSDLMKQQGKKGGTVDRWRMDMLNSGLIQQNGDYYYRAEKGQQDLPF